MFSGINLVMIKQCDLFTHTGKETAESIFNLRFKPQKVMHIPDNDVKIEKKLTLLPVKKDKCYFKVN